MKKGVTIIELLVAMTIFIVVVTIAVGAFVSVSRMKALTSTMKETQQKTRIALEMITRLSRQAEKIITYPDNQRVDLYFNLDNAPYAVKFEIKDDVSGINTLFYSECEPMSATTCTSWTGETDLYTGIEIVSGNFIKIGTIPPTLSVELYGKIGDETINEYYSDKINLNTSIVLEGIK